MARKSEAKRAAEPPKRRRGRPAKHGRESAEDEKRWAEQFPGARVIKRYGNRRLYDAKLSRSVTVTEIAGFIRRGEDVRVVDADTGDDLTRRVLTQIILEEENAGVLEMLPAELLRTMIAMRSEPLHRWLQQYLAAGARWLEMQMAAAGPAAQAMQSQLGALFSWPPAPGGAKGEGARTDGREGDLRKEIESLWERLASIQTKRRST